MKRPNITPGDWSSSDEAYADVWTDHTESDGLKKFVCAKPYYGHTSRMTVEKARQQWACDRCAIAALPKVLAALEPFAAYFSEESASDGTRVSPSFTVQQRQAARAALIDAGYTFD